MSTHDQAHAYEFSDLLGSLHSLVLSADEVQTFLEEVTRLAARLVDPPASVGITTHYDGHPVTAAVSDERAALIDEEQYGAGDGPCLTAMRSGQMQSVDDVAHEDRWQEFMACAHELGVQSILAMPLVVRGERRGALNIYAFDGPGRFTEEQVRKAEVFAVQAATALALTLRHIEQTQHSTQLEQALRSRSVIDQAVGVLMAQQKCDAHTAFGLLRQHSQNHNLKLRDVARSLIERHTGTPVSDPAPFRRAGHDGAGA